MKIPDLFKSLGWVLLFCSLTVQAATTDLAGVPLVTSSPSAVLPNIMYVLDDSGSMDWNYLPDWANSSNNAIFKNADYNGVYYSPAIAYTPPTAFNADGTVDTGSYPNQTSANTAAWTSVKDDGYGVQSNSSSNLVGNALSYTMVAGEYCSAPNLRSCIAASSPSAGYPYPAKLRWCTTAALTTCQAVRIETGATTYTNARYPSPRKATITVGGAGSTSLSSIKVGGLEILSAATAASNSSSTVASNIVSSINSCSTGLAGNCQAVGYAASRAGSVVTLTAPGVIGVTPAITKAGAMTFTATAFAAGAVPGSNLLTVITSTNNSYPYPGTATKATTRTDCAGSTCTYAEEMTNYANWWSYYHTRMQMMKTAISISFAPIGSSYRVGYLSINNNTAHDFLNIAKFDNAQKKAWYTKFFSAIPNNSTPLRTALSKAGRVYGGKLNGATLNGSVVSDPVQYSCQQNFTIMSTDGYWNEADPGGYQLDGVTAVGNQDGGEQRPYFDGSPGTSNTLADVAEYYYVTDLRTAALGNNIGALGSDVATNNVPSNGLDGASWQHMTSLTLGLGASGYMQYSPSYMTAASGDYFDVKNGTTANPAAGICSWQSSGACNWPVPVSNTQPNIDDLWHAAVNGRGSYFSAGNPASLSAGLGNALAGVSARSGAAAAATTSNPNVTSGDNFVFSSTFTTVDWTGELVRQRLDLTTGVTSTTIDWSAQAKLDANAARTIYTFDPVAASHLKTFTWANLTATEQAYFNTPNISTLSQFCAAGVTCLSAATQASAAGAPLVSFLAGDRSNEGALTDTSKYYRQRAHLLGDIVNAEAVYVKTPLYNYADFGYGAFIAANTARQGMVYAAANDGMLHAFYAADGAGVVGGQEAWAFIPSLVLPGLFKLADKNYANLHQYFVDGTPTVGDICTANCTAPAPPATTPAAVWKTILVGGLNGGGRGYYALDITDPTAPKALWQFTDSNLGYSYGNPKITKLEDGTWVVLLASGYNNVSPGDGQGRLYVLNALTGAVIRSIATGVGSAVATVAGACGVAPCPSGLAKISARVVNPMSNNTVQQVYGGDLYGNLWRFDVNGDVGAAGYDAQLLATLRGSGGNLQPITTLPQLGIVSGYGVVFVGTGKYLGSSDLADVSGQSFYAIKDPLTAATTPGNAIYPNPRTFGGFVQQTMTVTTCPAGSPATICTVGQVVRTGSSNAVNFATNNGWFVDLPDGGERANTDPSLALGTLGFNTNIPSSDACTVGGYSNRYFLDFRTGAAVSTSTTAVVAARLGNALATRPVFVRLPNNTVVELTRMSDGTTITSDVPIGNAAATTRRVSWRQLVDGN